MPIVVDAMGGDHAPDAIVQGAVLAARELDDEVVLVGREDAIRDAIGAEADGVRVVHAPEVVEMGEHPAKALKRKPENSVSVGMKLAAEPGSAFVSAGSTGAVMAGALFGWGRLPGIERPAIAGLIPSRKGTTIVADVGANVDCKPSHIGQFAVLAAAYSSHLMKIERPRVGILNIGTEASKGNESVREARAHLEALGGIDFVGNVEPEGVYSGEADVVVTDGFPGNIFLKTSEAVAGTLGRMVKEAAAQVGDALQPLLETFARFDPDHSDNAGAPLLGVDGTAIIVHGDARAETIRNAVKLASRAAASGYLDHLRTLFRSPEG